MVIFQFLAALCIISVSYGMECPVCTEKGNPASCTEILPCHQDHDVCEMTLHLRDENRIEFTCRNRPACNHQEVQHCDVVQHERCWFCCASLDACKMQAHTVFESLFGYSTAAPTPITTPVPDTTTAKPTTPIPTTPIPTTPIPTTPIPTTTTPIPTTTTPKPTTTTPKPTTTTPIPTTTTTTPKPTTTTPRPTTTTPKPTTTTPKPTTTTPIPTTTTTTPKPTTTTPRPTTTTTTTTAAPNICIQCNVSEPCDAYTVQVTPPSLCDAATPYCFTTIVQNRDIKNIYKGCADRNWCLTNYWQTTIHKPECLENDYTDLLLDCSFCCTGVGCNLPVKPYDLTLVKF